MIRRLTFTLVATLSMFAMPLPANASGDESVAREASAGRVLTLYGYPLWQVLHSSGRGAALATATTRRSQPLPLTQGRDLRHQDPRLPDQARMRDSPVSLSGPRFGFTFLSDDIVRKLSDDYQINVAPVVSQFGWQFERRFTSGENGPTALNEWVLLVGGLEQGVVIPSLTWLVGIRTRDGAEFGLGPNLTPAGFALALAGGFTFRMGDLNVPVNVAVVPSRSGMRVSVLTGWNLLR